MLETTSDITQKHRTEQALMDRELKYRLLADNTIDIIWMMDMELNFTYVNPAVESITGIPAGEWIGTNLREVSSVFEYNKMKKLLAEADDPETQPSFNIQTLVKIKDGKTLPVEIRGKLLFDSRTGKPMGIQGTTRDISDNLRRNRQLKDLHDLINRSPITVFFLSNEPGLPVMYISENIEGLCGYTAGEFMDGSVIYKSLIHPDDALKQAESLLQDAPARKSRRQEYRIIDKAGTTKWIEEDIWSIRDEYNRITHFQGIIMDVTARKKSEQELYQSQKLEAIGTLASGIAHEINTPIQFIGDNARFLSESVSALFMLIGRYRLIIEELLPANPELAQAITQAEKEADFDFIREEIPLALEHTDEGVSQVSRIVVAMKNFARMDSMVKDTADLNLAIRTTATICRNEWKHAAEIIMELDEDMPMVNCFAGDIKQAILNLIVNATHSIKDANGGESGRRGTITLRSYVREQSAVIEVSDTGTGIPEKIRDRIFEPFFTTKEVGKGSGQGLHIVYTSIVEKHKGSLTFDTEVGKGTTFRIEIPLK